MLGYDSTDETDIEKCEIINEKSSGSNDKCTDKLSIENNAQSEVESNVSMANLYLSENHFIDKLSIELNNIKTQHADKNDNKNENDDKKQEQEQYFSNSPLTMSICSSRFNSDIDSDCEIKTLDSKMRRFKKVTYEEVEYSLNKHYTKELQISSELDILLTYLKGQRHIFNQANRVTIQKFNFLMFPAIFVTGSMTVLSPFLESVEWSGWLFSVLNAILTVMITINNFMKWQAVAAIYLTISNQFDKLAISVEMSRNEFIFVENKVEKGGLILEKMKETEKRIMDIQNNYNDIVIPYEIQLMNPIISHINIFSFIKKIEHHKKGLIVKYKDVKNNIRYVMHKWEYDGVNSVERSPDELGKMQKLLDRKEDIKIKLIQNSNNNVYAYIDNLFIREIQLSEKYYTYHSAGMYYFFRPKPLERKQHGNPVVDEYLNFIFTD